MQSQDDEDHLNVNGNSSKADAMENAKKEKKNMPKNSFYSPKKKIKKKVNHEGILLPF
ncbi:hypothetical protein TIFTF001_016144 [Ficus carica]|uniref:Uncharacterized protein n=1 Tax=Ficus carica TaxID=3494 RepID=A0AA88D757_FICCA|nr:hypothetical protein TIFTF001_016144 [Ficus carica]